jgi:hypothetical protein
VDERPIWLRVLVLIVVVAGTGAVIVEPTMAPRALYAITTSAAGLIYGKYVFPARPSLPDRSDEEDARTTGKDGAAR